MTGKNEASDCTLTGYDLDCYVLSIAENYAEDVLIADGGPNGDRTRVSGVRGQRPGPLDDGTRSNH